jgi:hypothetical protein
VRWVIASFDPLKAGPDPPLCGLYRHLLISSLINRRCNDVARGLNDLGWGTPITLNRVKKLAT